MKENAVTRFLKENRRMLLLTILSLIAGLMIGISIGLAMQPLSEDAVTVDHSGVVCVLPDTSIQKRIQFVACGHTHSNAVDPHAFVGYTEEELAAFYADLRLSMFSAEQVLLLGSAVGYCPEHYVLCLQDGVLSIQRTNAETFYFEEVQTLSDAHLEGISDETREQLESGIAFDTLSEINAFLESSES